MIEDLEYKEKYLKYKNKYIEYKMKFPKLLKKDREQRHEQQRLAEKQLKEQQIQKQRIHNLSYSHLFPIEMTYNPESYTNTDINHMIYGMGCNDEGGIEGLFNGQQFYIEKNNQDSNNFNIRNWCNNTPLSTANNIFISVIGSTPKINLINEIIKQIIIDLKYIKYVNNSHNLNLKVKISGHSFGGAIINRIAEKLNTPFLLTLTEQQSSSVPLSNFTFKSNTILQDTNIIDFKLLKENLKDITLNEYKELLQNLILSTFGTIYIAKNVSSINIINYISKGDIAKLVAWNSGNSIMTHKIVLKNNFEKNITLFEFGEKYNNIIPICLYKYYNYENINVSFTNDNNSSWYIGKLYNYDISSEKICDKKLKEAISWTIHGNYFSFMQIIDFIYDNYKMSFNNDFYNDNKIKIEEIFNENTYNSKIIEFFKEKLDYNDNIFNDDSIDQKYDFNKIDSHNKLIKNIFQEINNKIKKNYNPEYHNIIDDLLDFEYMFESISEKFKYISKYNKIKGKHLNNYIIFIYNQYNSTSNRTDKEKIKLELKEYLLFYFTKNLLKNLYSEELSDNILLFFNSQNNYTTDETIERFNIFKNEFKQHELSISICLLLDYNLEIIPIQKKKSIFNWGNTVSDKIKDTVSDKIASIKL